MVDMRNSVPNNLPIPLTSFVGREQAIAEVRSLLAGTRLLTLTGAGGCGKSRLALRVATAELGRFPGGVWLVDLAPLSDPGLVPQAVASALGVLEQPGRMLVDTLADYLRQKSLLLVLDNCEHLLVACTHLVDALLRVCADLRILATSREALGVPGEIIWRVPSLSMPGLSQVQPHDRLMEYEAVRLFVERADAVQAGFKVTEPNAHAVAQVCRRLDGIPLAIELSAARVKALTVEQIAGRLDDRFRLLTGGSRTGLPRHRTLRAAMDWSYDLLSERERVVLNRLSAFAGGWTLEAAEAVCAGAGVEASDILDVQTSLVDKSLVNVEAEGGEARYRLLETVRQYAQERLTEAGEAEAVRGRHRDWYLELAERAEPELRGPGQGVWMERLLREYDNLRAALEWSRAEESGADASLRLAGALVWFWHVHGTLREAQAWLEGALSKGSGASAASRAKALCGAGHIAYMLDEYNRASPLLEESLELFRQLNDRQGIGFALHFLAHVAQVRGDFDRAGIRFEQSLAQFREVGDDWGCALTLDCFGGLTLRGGDYDRAASLCEESLALYTKLGQQVQLWGPLSALGRIAAARGDYTRAEALAEEGLNVAREAGYTRGVAGSLSVLGHFALRQGACERAAALFRESLVIRRETGEKEPMATCLNGLAAAVLGLNRPVEAARFFGIAAGLRESIGAEPPPDQRDDYERHMTVLRSKLDETMLATAWAAGRAMTLEQAIEYALEPREAAPRTVTRKEASTADSDPTILTVREREVAALIAQGLTNREIATRLVVAERTAEGHVQNILNKLGFNTRAQIAAWAVERGLRAVKSG